jgi:hypothetical protein
VACLCPIGSRRNQNCHPKLIVCADANALKLVCEFTLRGSVILAEESLLDGKGDNWIGQHGMGGWADGCVDGSIRRVAQD